ncbi:MAG: trypsin-like peptidase domain-containing protein [Kiritimatiellae bacterium]|nr:trypsin-like peptidase domain-containing protein [Kiritimatiellia bacterium]
MRVRSSIRRIVSGALLMGMALAGSGCPGAAPPPTGAAPARRTPVVDAVERALPAVVNISTERLVQVSRSDPLGQLRGDLFDRNLQELFLRARGADGVVRAPSLGSGVVIDSSGYILTNYHVVERASSIRVTLADNTTLLGRQVAGDPIHDLALIQVDPPKPLPEIRLAADGDAMLGETVIVLGNPFGLGHSVTMGVLSARNREATYQGQVLFQDILQTDAAVNPGNSGGPLINIEGDLIGINVAARASAENISFAVPVHRARALLVQWLSPMTRNRMALGFDLEERDGAVMVTTVDPRGPAANSGLRPRDCLAKVNDSGVHDLLDFVRALIRVKSGDEVSLAVRREGSSRTFRVRPVTAPLPSAESLASIRLGLRLGSAGETSAPLGMPVTDVLADGAAYQAGLRAREGLMLASLNGIRVLTPEAVALALERVRPGEEVMAVFIIEDVRPGAWSRTVQSLPIRAGGEGESRS